MAKRNYLVLLLMFFYPAVIHANQQDFDRLIQWLTGRWDNQQQILDDERNSLPEFDRHLHYGMVYVPIRTPLMRGQLFAIKSYNEDGFNGPISRVALHRFTPVEQSDEIMHEFLFLLDKEKWGDLKQDLGSLSQLSDADIRLNRNCRMYWQWKGDHFEASTRKGQCVTSSYTPTEILVEGHALLYPDRLVRHDMNYELSGEVRPRQGGSTPELFDKVD